MRSSSPKVLFVGDAWLGSNARSLAKGFCEVGAEVVHIDTTGISRPRKYGGAWVYLKVRGNRRPADVERVHREIESATRIERPDILFCFKSIHLDQDRLLSLPVETKVHYSADDVSNPVNISPAYLAHESRWDLVVMTKRHNIGDIRARTNKDPLFIWSAYDRAWHHPFPRSAASSRVVSFIGNLGPDRRQLMVGLAERYGRELRLCGPGWSSVPSLRRSDAFVGPGAYGEAFSQEVARASAHLVLLNSDNRDTHTCRSFEIPAAGGLFVGERTAEHEEIIEHEKTGYLFDEEGELLEILERVRNNPEHAAQLARAGYRSITGAPNDYQARAREILAHLGSRTRVS